MSQPAARPTTLGDFHAVTIDGKDQELGTYVGDVVLVVNEGEGAAISGLTGEVTIQRVVESLLGLGPKRVALTVGAAGVIGIENGSVFAVPGVPVDVIDTTGAGDAFNAGYLAARCQGLEQGEAVAAGQAVSAEVLKSAGARAHRETVRALGTRLFPGQPVLAARKEGFALDDGATLD